ncbi:MAG: 16S rRNA (uracil(1498)-N(3))-methyltransferase [Hydrogenophilales bacterium 28-61-23]|nr:MAG: 16S rRNA (uracil(1498)-N(3))-methyltransferase [Hydrogenophilales bacterium 28-61-23]
MPRFYCDLPLAVGRLIELPVETARHAIGALRLREGEPVTLFNGDGVEYHGTLAQQGKSAAVRLTERAEPKRESNLHITLVQGLSSGERMDLTLQKSVELGVAAIQPVFMRRSIVKLSGDKAERRLQHWRGVVVAACEQCGRNRIPPVGEIQEFMSWLRQQQNQADAMQSYLLDPEAETGLRDLPAPNGRILLLAGPEGGFDPIERGAAVAAGCQRVRLGPRILRTETAALAAIAAMQAVWGDF